MSTSDRAVLEALFDGDADRWQMELAKYSDEKAFALMMAAFGKACYLQFPADPDLQQISSYVADLSNRYAPIQRLDVVATERLIRFVFGDEDALLGLDASAMLQGQTAVVSAVASDHRIQGAERERFIQEVIEAVSGHDRSTR